MIESFGDLVGNVSTIHVIREAISVGTFQHFSILAGTHGTGKSTCADLIGMALTCEHPNNGQACLKCRVCRDNLSALASDGQASRFKKINLGSRCKRDDVDSLIKEIFVLDSGEGRVFYELGELHSWAESMQTALLEEIDRISPNVYVVATTTKLRSILPELASRATPIFQFNRITQADAKFLLDRLCGERGYRLSEPIQSMIIRYARGIPRDLERIVNFIGDTGLDEDEVRGLLGYVSDDTVVTLLQFMSSGDMPGMVSYLNQITQEYGYEKLIPALRDVCTRGIYLKYGVNDEFSPKTKKVVKELFDKADVNKVAKVVEQLTEDGFRLSMLRLNQAMQGQVMSDVVKENANRAARQSIRAEARRNDIAASEQKGGELHKLTPEFMQGFGDNE